MNPERVLSVLPAVAGESAGSEGRSLPRCTLFLCDLRFFLFLTATASPEHLAVFSLIHD